MSSRNFLIGFLLAAAALGLLVAGCRKPPAGIELAAGIALNPPRPIVDFELVDHTGANFTRAAFKNHWSVVFAGFTHCPDICPDTLWRLDLLDSQLRAGGGELQTVFVSVDPERDTPEALASYVGHFNAQFIGATGDREQIDALCNSLGIDYIKIPGGRGDYSVDHSAALVLVDPEARVAGYFRPPFDFDQIAEDLGPIIGARD